MRDRRVNHDHPIANILFVFTFRNVLKNVRTVISTVIVMQPTQ